MGNLVCTELGLYRPETLQRFFGKEIGSRLLWLDSMARVDQAEAEALADTVGVDEDFPAFADWCRARQIPMAVVSDGFHFYIRRILQREGLDWLPVFANELTGPGELTFPHGNAACDFCACCKAAIARQVRQRAPGARIIYVGDGVSDLYAARFADWIFAKGHLAEHLQRSGTPFYAFDAFGTVHRTLQEQFDQFAAGTAPRRAENSPDPRCRFPD